MNAQAKEVTTVEAWNPDSSPNALPAPMTPMTPMAMLGHAVANGASVEVLERLMGLSERLEKNRARNAFDAAIASAKADIPPILRDKEVDFTGKTGIRTHYRHETLAAIAKTIDPILGKNGLSYRFRSQSPINEPITVTCIISHRDGYFEENTLVGPRDDSGNKNSLQAIGSTVTYLQRYTLKAALGLSATNDDDGAKAPDETVEATLSDEQVMEIRDLLAANEKDEKKLLAKLKVERLEDVFAKNFERVCALFDAGAAK